MTKRMGSGLWVAGALVALSGCIANNESLTLMGMVAPDALCQAAPGDLFVSRLIVDLSVARRATAFMVARNSMIPGASAQGRTPETRTVLVEGVNVKFRTGSFLRLAERFVHALSSVNPNSGQAVVPFEILASRDIDALRGDAALTRALAPPNTTVEIIANVKVQGRLTDGGNISSSEVPLAITLCRNCLQDPPGAMTPAGCVGMVAAPTAVCEPGVGQLLEFCQYEALRR